LRSLVSELKEAIRQLEKAGAWVQRSPVNSEKLLEEMDAVRDLLHARIAKEAKK